MSGIFTVNGKTYGGPPGEWADLETLEACREAEATTPVQSPLIAEWRTRGGRFWYKIYRNADSSYRYACDNGGGCLGILADDAEAIAEIERRVETSRMIDKINFERTL